MIEISEVLHQWQQGRSKTKISESLGIARPTLRKYLQLAMTAGLNALSSTTELADIALSGEFRGHNTDKIMTHVA